MENSVPKEKNILIRIIVTSVLMMSMILLFVFLLSSMYIETAFKKYENQIYPETYLNEENISQLSFDNLSQKIDDISEKMGNEKIVLEFNNNSIECTYQDLGLEINKDDTIKKVISNQKNKTFIQKMYNVLGKDKNKLIFSFNINEEKLNSYLNELKVKYDQTASDERFEVDQNRNIIYIKGQDGLSLNVEQSSKYIKDELNKSHKKIALIVDKTPAQNHELYQKIDTKVSSFTTTFNPYISRATNLKTGLGYIDGVILEPGEVFSFYKYAGPYNKRGYVFYYEFVGNGVCQIATTTYNAALLGGLEIVERYQHANKVPYVPGGLDATVASYASGWYVDMKFKNTYLYPIYISAYAINGEAHVDFWSNSEAKGGKTYSTESVRIGQLGYRSYLHVYENGQEIERRFLSSSWYKEEG